MRKPTTTAVTINWAQPVGDGAILVDGTVAGTHVQCRFERQALEGLGTKAARQAFIAQQLLGLSTLPSPPSARTGQVNDVAGTVNV